MLTPNFYRGIQKINKILNKTPSLFSIPLKKEGANNVTDCLLVLGGVENPFSQLCLQFSQELQ